MLLHREAGPASPSSLASAHRQGRAWPREVLTHSSEERGGDGMNAILSWGRLDNAVPPDFWVLPDGTGGLVAFFLN